jgi:hypothetical protein
MVKNAPLPFSHGLATLIAHVGAKLEHFLDVFSN